MGSSLGRVRLSVCATVLVSLSCHAICAERSSPSAAPRRALLSVLFVGCESDGQVGPHDAPRQAKASEWLDPALAQGLAYYQAAQGPGVLAPRGWFCFGTYGSGGDTLLVGPESIDSIHVFARDWLGLKGPGITVSNTFGGTSGRFRVAEILSRVFPNRRSFVQSVIRGEPDMTFPYVPFPGDRLRYLSTTAAEYVTKARADGLGTYLR